MKIRMSKIYRVYELYDTIEINKEDYPQLESMSDDEAFEYIKENMYDFELKDGTESTLTDEFEFGGNMIDDNHYDEEYGLHLVD